MGRVIIGPGPGKYRLPPLVGYKDHDGSRYRNPQYSIGMQLGHIDKRVSPGPKYQCERMTKYGKAQAPAYTLVSRRDEICKTRGPGPAAYGVQNCPRFREQRPPAYSMSYRQVEINKKVVPGPNIYDIPTTIGPKVPDKNAAGAFSMSSKHAVLDKRVSPGPAKYSPAPLNNYKNKLPQYSMRNRHEDLKKSPVPGPSVYFPKLGHPGGYSFGLRTDNAPYITADDNMPCINK